jgi:hypothetical protein
VSAAAARAAEARNTACRTVAEAQSTVVSAPSSMQKPRLGEWYVMLLPSERITL